MLADIKVAAFWEMLKNVLGECQLVLEAAGFDFECTVLKYPNASKNGNRNVNSLNKHWFLVQIK